MARIGEFAGRSERIAGRCLFATRIPSGGNCRYSLSESGERRPENETASDQQEQLHVRIAAEQLIKKFNIVLIVCLCVLVQGFLILFFVTDPEKRVRPVSPLEQEESSILNKHDKRTRFIGADCAHDIRNVPRFCSKTVFYNGNTGRFSREGIQQAHYSGYERNKSIATSIHFGEQETQKESQDKESATSEPKIEMTAITKSLFSRQSRLFSISTISLYNLAISACNARFCLDKNRIVSLWSSLRCSSVLVQKLIPRLSTASSFTLNPFTDYADNETCESETPQRDRHEYLFWTFCRPATGTAGQCRAHHTRTRRIDRGSALNDRCVGSWEQRAENRTVAHSCRSPWSHGAYTDTTEVIHWYKEKRNAQVAINTATPAQYFAPRAILLASSALTTASSRASVCRRVCSLLSSFQRTSPSSGQRDCTAWRRWQFGKIAGRVGSVVWAHHHYR